MKRFYTLTRDRPLLIWLTIGTAILIALLWFVLPHFARPEPAPVIEPSELSEGMDGDETIAVPPSDGDGASEGATTNEATGGVGALGE